MASINIMRGKTEKTRPERVRGLMAQWADTFVSKNHDYGMSYILTGRTLELWFPEGIVIDTSVKHVFMGLLVRMLDKMLRASNLILRGKDPQIDDEKAYETLADLGDYSFMAAEAILNGVEPGKD